MTSSLRVLLALCLLAFAPLLPAQTESPALWKIAGPKSNVYLFGSFHLLPKDVHWRTQRIGAALDEAKVVVLEIDPAVSQDQQAVMQLIVKHGLLPQGQTLPDVLPPEVNAELERQAAALGMPPASLAPMRPWLAALMLGVQFIVSQGYDPNAGVDHQIAAWARQSGRTVAGLESMDDQFRGLAGLKREQEIELLAVSLKQIRETPQMLSQMLAAYRKGDVAGIERLMNDGFKELPGLRKSMLRDRHENWLPRIQRMIADGRTHFVVVGAAHLAGPDSVVAMLRATGIKVEGP
jgi:uncharacterized protein YbaP (TraB family)